MSVLPDKYVQPRASLIGQAALILQYLGATPRTVSELWSQLLENDVDSIYEDFIFALDLLFMMDVIELNSGLVRRRREN